MYIYILHISNITCMQCLYKHMYIYIYVYKHLVADLGAGAGDDRRPVIFAVAVIFPQQILV